MKVLAVIVCVILLLGVYRLLGHKPVSSGQTQANFTSGMSAEEACAVLGISHPASRQAAIDAHRKLMQHLHPDKGGSAHLAQQLNEAKRVLLSNN